MRRARIIALVAVPVLLLSAGCRDGIGARGGGAGTGTDNDTDADTAPVVTGPATAGEAPDSGSGDAGVSGGSGGGSPDAGGSGGVEQQFDDVEATLSSIESEMAAQDGGR
jgi:hypothetical protein